MDNQSVVREDSLNISIYKIIRIILSRWYWIALSVFICSVLCILFLKTTQPKFESKATLKFNDNKQSEIPTLGDIILPKNNKNEEILAQAYFIKSFNVISATLDSLQHNFVFSIKRGLRSVTIFPERPFTAKIIFYDPDVFEQGSFALKNENGKYRMLYSAKESISFDLNGYDTISVKGLKFAITSPIDKKYPDIGFYYIDYYEVINGLSTSLSVTQTQKNVPLLDVSFVNNNKLFTRQFLATLLHTYTLFDLQEKRKSSEQTLKFINDQLDRFELLLKASSNKLEGYKKQYDFIDIKTSSQELMQSLTDLRTQKNLLEIQKQNINLLNEDIQHNNEILTGSGGVDKATDEVLVKLIEELNKYKTQKKQLLLNYSEQSSVVKNIDDEIGTIKSRIIENIRLQKDRIAKTQQVIEQQTAQINARIGTIPTAEKDLVYLTSDVDVNKNIYNLLLNKKLETSITKAGVLPSFTIIDEPKVSIKTYPKTVLVAVAFIFLGMAIGLGYIFVKRMLNNKFSNLEKLGILPNVSVLGVINHFQAGGNNKDVNNLTELLHSRSVFSETINAIRTNVSYLTQNGKKKVIAITSEISGEGKSFSSLNIAISLTKLNKKVVIIASDLRKSKLHRYINSPNRTGLSSFLANDQAKPSEIIIDCEIPNLSIITSGPVPLNPSELLYEERFWSLIDELKETYDYIIIDTAPIGLVSDSIPILRKADINIFILRWLYSNQSSYELPVRFAQEYNLKNIFLIVNDFKKDEFYGSITESSGNVYGGYSKYYANYSGYYNSYFDEEKSFFKRIKNRIFSKSND